MHFLFSQGCLAASPPLFPFPSFFLPPGYVARLRKQEVEKINAQLRQININLRKQARAWSRTPPPSPTPPWAPPAAAAAAAGNPPSTRGPCGPGL